MKKHLSILFALLVAAHGGGSAIASDVPSGRNLTGMATTADFDASSKNGSSLNSVDSSGYLVRAFQTGLTEIRLSQLALQNAAAEDVKIFAQRMILDHTQANNAMSQLALQRGISLLNMPSPEQNAVITQLQNLSGRDFDLAYMDFNVRAHESAVMDAREQSTQGMDAEVRTFSVGILPILIMHQDLAERINAKLNPAAFLVSAFKDGQAEIMLSELALQRASNEAVRAFAQRMIHDHTLVNQQLAPLAASKSVSLPTEVPMEHHAIHEELSQLTGKDFDKAYMDFNVIDHKKAVELFSDQSAQGLDPDIKVFAASILPALTVHLQLATDLNNGLTPGFLFEAYRSGLAEIELSHLALLKSSNTEIRDYAKRMIADQTQANTKIAQFGMEQNIALPHLPAAEHKFAFAELAQLSGPAFDNKYMEITLKNHEKDMNTFQRQSTEEPNRTIREFISDTLPVMQSHLTSAQEIAGRMGLRF